MSLAEHTKIHLEQRGKLTKIGEIIVESLNEMAAAHVAGDVLPNHSPAAPAYWFAGLCREHSGPGEQFSNDPPLASAFFRSQLSDDAIVLARDVLRCSCDYRWGQWVMPHDLPATRRDSLRRRGTLDHDYRHGEGFACYACAFDAHAMCIHGCTANSEVLHALDEELAARGLPAYQRPSREVDCLTWLDEPDTAVGLA